MTRQKPGLKLPGLNGYVKTDFDRVPGWLHYQDLEIFDFLLAMQWAHDITGDLLEIGAYQGKSAIVLGYGLRPNEKLVVNDLFGMDADVSTEGMEPYADLTRQKFEGWYGRFHEYPAEILQCPSSQLNLANHYRFIHIDGGHAYDEVARDIETIQHADAGRAVVVLDDYRTYHTPGVTAAAWKAVYEGKLFPFLISEAKMYATIDGGARKRYTSWVRELYPYETAEHEIMGGTVLRTL